MRKHSFLYGAVILSIAGLFAKGLGAIYKIPLTNILGTYGIGIYYLIFPIYSILLVLCSSGVSVAVARFVAVSNKSCDDTSTKSVLRAGLIIALVASTISATILILLSGPIARAQGSADARIGIIGIAGAIVFASLIAVFRGYFQGLENMVPTSVSNVVEQVAKIAFGLVLARILISRGISYAVFGATIGVTICEFVTLIILFIRYLVYIRSKPVAKCMIPTPEHLFRDFLRYSIFSTISSLFLPLCSLFDSFVIINILHSLGMGAEATSIYGIAYGVVATLVSIPVIFTVALTTVLVPNISGVEDAGYISSRCTTMIKFGYLLSLLFFILMLTLGPDIISILYGGSLDRVVEYEYATRLLALATPEIIYQAFLQIFSGVLQAINRPRDNVYAFGFAFIIRTALIFVLVSYRPLNIFGAIIAQSVFLIVAATWQIIVIRRHVQLDIKFGSFIARPILLSVGLIMILGLAREMLINQNIWLRLGILGGAACLIYGIVVLFCGVLDETERGYFTKIFSKKVNSRD